MTESKKPPTAAPPPTPVQIVFNLPDRKERLALPDPYAPHWVEIVTNQPDAAFADLTMPQALALAITGWSLTLADGTAAPITAEALLALPPDVYNWLYGEFLALRQRPLPPTYAVASPPSTA